VERSAVGVVEIAEGLEAGDVGREDELPVADRKWGTGINFVQSRIVPGD
jgi:hypothetical protein